MKIDEEGKNVGNVDVVSEGREDGMGMKVLLLREVDIIIGGEGSFRRCSGDGVRRS